MSDTVMADQNGLWFEHVYPLNVEDPVRAVKEHLVPLMKYAHTENAFFVIPVVQGSLVVMPAVQDKRIWSAGASKRYADYIQARDVHGQPAAGAVIIIDPGETSQGRVSNYTNSEQIGVLDSYMQAGQLAIDASYPEGYVVDRIEEVRKRGVIQKVARALTSGAVGQEYGVTIDVFGQEVEVLETIQRRGLDWKIPR